MSQGETNWPFLMLTTRSLKAAATRRSVWRHRKAGICRMSATSATVDTSPASCTSVRIGNLYLVLYFFENAQAFFEPGSAEAFQRGAVGFVVGGFEDEREVQRAGDALDDLRHADGMLFALDDARAGDQEEMSRADADVIELEGDCHQVKSLNHRGHRGTRRKSSVSLLSSVVTGFGFQHEA